MVQDYSIGSTVRNVFVTPRNPINTAKTGLFFASRKLGVNNSIPPAGSNGIAGLYVPFALPTFTSGLDALNYLETLGFNYVLGKSFTSNLSNYAVSSVVTNPTTGLTTLNFNDPSIGVQYLVGQNPAGTITQQQSTTNTAVGTIVSVAVNGSVSSIVVLPTTPNVPFVAGSPVNVNAELADLYPDPLNSDDVCVVAFWFYEQYLRSYNFATTPTLYLSVTADGVDSSISPKNDSFSIGAPLRVDTQPDGSINLTYSYAGANLGRFPNQYFGNTVLTQTIVTTGQAWSSVIRSQASNGSTIVGVGTTINTSLDNGVSWTVYTPPQILGGSLRGVYYDGNRFIVVGDTVTPATGTSFSPVYISVDGINWTFISIAAALNYSVNEFGNSGQSYLIGGLGGALSSTSNNFNTIDIIKPYVHDQAAFTSIANNGTLAVAVGGASTTADVDANPSLTLGQALIYYSATPIGNPSSWAAATTTIPGDLYAVVYAESKFVAVGQLTAGNAPVVAHSTDGNIWTQVNFTGTPSQIIQTLAYGNTVFVAAGSIAGTIFFSLDGLTWVVNNIPSAVAGANYSVSFNGSQFVYMNNTGTSIFVSSDGLKWANTTATAVFNGYSLGANNTVVINAFSQSGPFSTLAVNPVSAVLDSTKNGFSFLDNIEIAAFGLSKQVQNGTVLQNTYADFYNGVNAARTVAGSKNKKYNVQGYIAYNNPGKSVPASTISMVDSPAFVFGVKLDYPTITQPALTSGAVAASLMYNDLNNEYPFYGTSGTLSGQLALVGSNNTSSQPTKDILNQLCSQGCNPIAVDVNNNSYIYRNLCALQTVNGIPNNEFNNQDVQLKVRWLDKNIVNICDTAVIDITTGMRLNNNPALAGTITKQIQTLLNNGYNNGNGILGNTNNSVTVVLNPADVTRFLVTVTTSVVPANSGSDITVYAFSYTF